MTEKVVLTGKEDLILVSNSMTPTGGYLDHCAPAIKQQLTPGTTVMFVPYARPGGKTLEEYTALARPKFEEMGLKLKGIQEFDSPLQAVEEAEAIFIGGGSTFTLLKGMYDAKIIDQIRRKVRNGTPYIGTSAGSNVAGMTMNTTNDMPIAKPRSFESLKLVPCIFNPHYIDSELDGQIRLPLSEMGVEDILRLQYDPKTGEKVRKMEIGEYHTVGTIPVVALKEGTWLRVKEGRMRLEGEPGGKIFFHDGRIVELNPNDSLDELLIA